MPAVTWTLYALPPSSPAAVAAVFCCSAACWLCQFDLNRKSYVGSNSNNNGNGNDNGNSNNNNNNSNSSSTAVEHSTLVVGETIPQFKQQRVGQEAWSVLLLLHNCICFGPCEYLAERLHRALVHHSLCHRYRARSGATAVYCCDQVYDTSIWKYESTHTIWKSSKVSSPLWSISSRHVKAEYITNNCI